MSNGSAPGPPDSVLRSFGVHATAIRRLEGGQGTTWEAGDVVLKPVGNPLSDRWVAETMAALDPTGYRVPRPIRALNGDWLADDWCAWSKVAGEHRSHDRWSEILNVARHHLQDLARLPRPDFLDARTDQWATGDRAAWETKSYAAAQPPIGALISRCERMRQPEGLTDQVIHGDIFGNVLLEQGLAPAVIDLSPYWRPAAYGLAIAVVDAMAWYAAPPDVVLELSGLPGRRSLLARAAIFRLVTADVAAGAERLPPGAVSACSEFEPVVELIESLASDA